MSFVKSVTSADQPRVAYLVTSGVSARAFLRGQLGLLAGNGWACSIAADGARDALAASHAEHAALGVTVCDLPLSRSLRIGRELGAVVWHLRDVSPQVVNASTPKAGLLGMLAAWWCRVPVRVYVVRGLRYETATGWKRRLLLLTEKLACACAHRVVCVSESVRQEMIRFRLVSPRKAIVLAKGSSNGVVSKRFSMTDQARVAELRERHRIASESEVIGFVGRLTRDKGVDELYQSFVSLKASRPGLKLLVVGDFETGDPVPQATQQAMKNDSDVIITGFVKDTAPYYHLMTLLAFPSYREGFPNVPLEAACAALPTVGFAATGTVDAVVDGVTGTLVPVGDSAGLAAAIERYLDNPDLRKKHGQAGRERAERDFQPERIWEEMHNLYCSLLREKGIEPPARMAAAEQQAA